MINKELFTNGLVQVAIVLSLLRTDLEIYLNPISVPSTFQPSRQQHQHETIFDSLADYSLNDRLIQSPGLYPKAIEHDRFDRLTSVLNELHSLGDYNNRFAGFGRSVINTYLVSDPGPVRPTPGSIPLETGETTHPVSISHEANQLVEPAGSVGENGALRIERDENATLLSSNFGSNLTAEDLELIDNLYMQDVDIGVNRESYDGVHQPNLNNYEKTKEEESDHPPQNNEGFGGLSNSQDSGLQDGVEYPALDISTSLTVDWETGELVLVSSEQSALQSTQDIQGGLNEQVSDVVNQNYQAPDTPQIANIRTQRQSSFDERLLDVYDLLGLSEPVEPQVSDVWSSSLFAVADQYNDTALNDGLEDFEQYGSVSGMLTSNTGLMNNVTLNSAAVISNNIFADDTDVSQPAVSELFNSSEVDDMPFFLPEAVLSDSFASSTFGDGFGNYSPFHVDLVDFELDANQEDAVGYSNELHDVQQETGATSVYDYAYQDACADQSVAGLEDIHVTATFVGQYADEVIQLSTENADDADADSILGEIINGGNFVEVDDFDISDLLDDEIVSETMNDDFFPVADDWSSDSAVSSMASPTQQDMPGAMVGAEGGATSCLYDDDIYKGKYDMANTSFYYGVTPSRYASNFNQNYNQSANNTGSEPYPQLAAKSVVHDHTYNLTPGRKSREEIEQELRREREARATRCRDEKRAKAMKVPFTMEEIIDTSIEQFSQLMMNTKLTEAQQQLIRDIRRRGKNKMAAQNCRKRKLELIDTLEEQVAMLRKRREMLLQDRRNLEQKSSSMRFKLKRLESEVMQQLRNESGRPYDPRLYDIMQTNDGGLYIVPRSSHSAAAAAVEVGANDDKSGRKRKSKRKD